MSRSNPVSWLAHHARRGVADLPRNIVWVVDTAVKSPAASAGRTLQAVGHQAASAVAEVAPFADGADSRLHRVDAALERAHELEAQAREPAEAAKQRAEAAAKVEADGGKQLDAARETAAGALSPSGIAKLMVVLQECLDAPALGLREEFEIVGSFTRQRVRPSRNR